MVDSLDKLIERREKIIRAYEENEGFSDGIHMLLTDLYPDSAHFIYELLQNAEDMNATLARFMLKEDGLWFEHNGTKRNFNLADIDAITNIGHNVFKKNDPTSIGKFGVGFKAVFAYTATPEIHSGDYHFKIRDYFVPDMKDVPRTETIDDTGVEWTKFYLPFNNPQKGKTKAYTECLDGLKSIDIATLLFLQHINKIECIIGDEKEAVLERFVENDYYITLTKSSPNYEIQTSKWLRFCKPITIIDDKKSYKEFIISIAYSLKKNSNTDQDVIVPVTDIGRTFIYFPAEKEYSGLRFYINAPFASTVARDSVRNCEENLIIINAIAELVAESVGKVKQIGLLDHHFFEILPNAKDNLSTFYSCIRNAVYEVFQDNEYLPTRIRNRYTSAKNAIIGSSTIAFLFPEEYLLTLLGIEKKWLANASRNSLADQFIRSLGIYEFNNISFVNLFDDEHRRNTQMFLNQMNAKNINWFTRFFDYSSDVIKLLTLKHEEDFQYNLRLAKCIPCIDGQLYAPSDIYILPVNVNLIDKSTRVVNSDLFFMNGEYKETVYDFLNDFLEVKIYGPRTEIENILQKYTYGKILKLNDEYFSDIWRLIQYDEKERMSDSNNKSKSLNLASYSLFLYNDPEDNEFHLTRAEYLYLGKSYNNEIGKIIASVLNKPCLAEIYKEKFNESQIKSFINFAVRCGIKRELRIISCDVMNNPQFNEKLRTHAKINNNGTRLDYTIDELPLLLSSKNFKISKHIWELLSKEKTAKYAIATFSPNGSAYSKTCESTLIYYLKKYPWVPNKNGKLVKSSTLSIKNIHKDFVYQEELPLLKALQFNSDNTKQKEELAYAESILKKNNMVSISIERLAELEKIEDEFEHHTQQSYIAPRSGTDLLNSENKQKKGKYNDEGLVTKNGKTNIEKTFAESQKKSQIVKQLFGRISETNSLEKETLLKWYNGVCQICGASITTYNHKKHFIARNIIGTENISFSIRQTLQYAWNSLCLCPNCAAKYKYCSKDISDFFIKFSEYTAEQYCDDIAVKIILDDEEYIIHYKPEHFELLRNAIKILDKEYSK